MCLGLMTDNDIILVEILAKSCMSNSRTVLVITSFFCSSPMTDCSSASITAEFRYCPNPPLAPKRASRADVAQVGGVWRQCSAAHKLGGIRCQLN